MDTSQQPQVVVRPTSIRLDRPKEQKFVSDCLTILQQTRMAMGWVDRGVYTRESWLWKRAKASQRYEGNFMDRLDDPKSQIWKVSNSSLNLISVVIDQHKAKLSKDYQTAGFLALKPDGPEDQGFILKPAEQYLLKRADRTRLGRKLRDDCILRTLIRGETVFKALPSTRQRTVKMQVKRLLHTKLDGSGMEPARDSKGGFIHENDIWIPHSEDPSLQVLARDPVTQRPVGGIPTYSEKPVEIDVTVEEPSGSDISYPFWADFVCDLDAPTLNQATIKAHLFELKPDDLWDMLPRHLLTSQADEYYKTANNPQGSNSMPQRSDQSHTLWKKGESPDGPVETSTSAISDTRLYAEIWIRYDLDGDRHREDLCLLVDVAASWPIAYGHAHEVLRSTTRRHPFGINRILPVEKRWYGRAYEDKYGDLAENIDADLNRLSIEKAKSGNLIFENRQATEEGKAGIPLAFRSPRTYKTTADKTGTDAVQVVTVTPVIQDIEKSMMQNMTAFMSRVGGVTPGDTQGQELAANTATGMQILQEVKNEHVEARGEEIVEDITPFDGITGQLRLFAELELLYMSPSEVHRQFGNSHTPTGRKIPVMVPAIDPLTGAPMLGPDGQPIMEPLMEPVPIAPGMDGNLPGPEGSADTLVRSDSPASPAGPPVSSPPPDASQAPDSMPQTAPAAAMQPVMEEETVPTAATLLAWAKTLTPEKIHDMVKLVVSRSRSTQIIQNNDNILLLIQKFLTYPPNIQEIIKPLFVDMLLALDVDNPDALLNKLMEAGGAINLQELLSSENSPASNSGPQSDRKATDKPKPESQTRPQITGRPEPMPTPPPTPSNTLASAGI